MSVDNKIFSFILTILFCLIITPSTYSQKVKFKKDKIYVDKKEKYHFTKLNKGSIMTTDNLPNCELLSVDGQKLISFVDTAFYYVKLPNEKMPRSGFNTLACVNHSSGERSPIIMPQGFDFRKLIIQGLEDIGFFKGDMSVDDMYSKLINKLNLDRMDKDMIVKVEQMIEEVNNERMSNYKLTKEKYGDFVQRNPIELKVFNGSIKEDGQLLAKCVKGKSGSYSHSYEVVNNDNKPIAQVVIFQKEPTYKVRPLVLGDENFGDKFTEFQDTGGFTPETLDQKFYKIALYLVNKGFL